MIRSQKLFISLAILTLIAGFTAAKAQTIWYVKPVAAGTGSGNSWTNASSDIQAVINAAAANDQIWVAAGTYTPNRRADATGTISAGNRHNAFVLKKNVQLYGGFAGNETNFLARNWVTNVTTLSGDIGNIDDNSDNAYHVVIGAGNAGSGFLDGFMITGGNAGSLASYITVNGQDIYANSGGGIYSIASSPVVSNCTIINNTAIGSGAGIYNVSSTFTAIACNITGNKAGGDGGGMYNKRSYLVISDSYISNDTANYGGGIYNDSAFMAVIQNSLISKNSAYNNGGGLFHYGGTGAELINITLAGNTGYGSVYVGASSIAFKNCIVWNNADSIRIDSASSYASQYSLLQGRFDYPDVSLGNLDGKVAANDPLFTNPGNGIYTLKAGSPAINKGSNALFPGDINYGTDLAGNKRMFDNTIDMGAYERQKYQQYITTPSRVNQTYGNIPFSPSFVTATSGLPVSFTSADTDIASIDDAAGKIIMHNADSVMIRITQDGDNSYDPATVAYFKLVISPKNLTVAAQAQTKKKGEVDPDLTYTATGFANNDNESVMTGSLSRDTGEAIGVYAIRIGDLSAGSNYIVQFTGASFTITDSSSNTDTSSTLGIGWKLADKAGTMNVYPNPCTAGSVITINCNQDNTAWQGATLYLAELATGKVLQTIPVKQDMQVAMPGAAGTYTLTLVLGNGQKTTTRIIVY